MEFHRVKRPRMVLPIIPLIDILTILLIFFIVSTTFKKPRPVIPVNLPQIKEVPTATLLDTRSVLSVSETGELALEEVPLHITQLSRHLKAFIKVNPNRKLELKIDEKCPFGTLVTVWEALTEVGIPLKEIPHRVRTSTETLEEKK